VPKTRVIKVDFTGVPSGLPRKLKNYEEEDLPYEELKNRRVVGTEHMDFPDQALYGLAGKIVKKISPHTETHPAALLMHILARYGNIIGRTAYFLIEDTHHYANEFFAAVGGTSDARKGTANNRIAKVFERLDPDWERERCMSGFGSGEGLIKRIAEQGDVADESDREITVQFSDSRVFIREEELSSILTISARDGNTLGQVLRNAWDGKDLENNTVKGTLIARNPHVSAIGDITMSELKKLLSDVAKHNGSANRWAFMFVERTRLIPESTMKFDWSMEREQLREAIKFGKSRRRMFRTEAARVLWARRYKTIIEGASGEIADIAKRGPAHIARWSMIFALLECSDHIESEHLKAALSLWDYSLRSLHHIFNQFTATEQQQRIIDFVKQRNSSSLTDIREQLFHRNLTKQEIKAELEYLKKMKVLEQMDDGYYRKL
jgi:hypothetical protein